MVSSLCVFCGSSLGERARYAEAARSLGTTLAARGLRLVYGGSNRGVMAEVAGAALAGGGDVIGVIPRALEAKEVAHRGLTELRVVESMHERKSQMAALADGFVALPGGLGTLEELFEIMTWGQLGFHKKPFGLLNVEGFFDPLIAFLDHLVAEGFLLAEHRRMLAVAGAPKPLLAALERYEPPDVEKWIGPRSL